METNANGATYNCTYSGKSILLGGTCKIKVNDVDEKVNKIYCSFKKIKPSFFKGNGKLHLEAWCSYDFFVKNVRLCRLTRENNRFRVNFYTKGGSRILGYLISNNSHTKNIDHSGFVKIKHK